MFCNKVRWAWLAAPSRPLCSAVATIDSLSLWFTRFLFWFNHFHAMLVVLLGYLSFEFKRHCLLHSRAHIIRNYILSVLLCIDFEALGLGCHLSCCCPPSSRTSTFICFSIFPFCTLSPVECLSMMLLHFGAPSLSHTVCPACWRWFAYFVFPCNSIALIVVQIIIVYFAGCWQSPLVIFIFWCSCYYYYYLR